MHAAPTLDCVIIELCVLHLPVHTVCVHVSLVGVEARSGKGVLNRVAEADVILHIPQKDRDVDVFGKPIYEWARDLQAKFETAE